MRVSTVPGPATGSASVMRILEKGTGLLARQAIGMAAPRRWSRWRRAHPPAPRHPAGERADRARASPPRSTAAISEINHAPPEHPHHRGPGGVRDEGHRAGPGQPQDRADLRPSALRAFLRQDPDVILVGEIRDRETAGQRDRGVADGPPGVQRPSTPTTAAGAFVRLVRDGGSSPTRSTRLAARGASPSAWSGRSACTARRSTRPTTSSSRRPAATPTRSLRSETRRSTAPWLRRVQRAGLQRPDRDLRVPGEQ